MKLLEKFLNTAFEEPFVLVCDSKTHMLRAKSLLEKENIKHDLIPTPKGFGTVCTTAIKFSKADLKLVKSIVKNNKINTISKHSLS